MFEVPSLLPYPKIYTLAECPEIVGQFCYIIKPYSPGITVIIKLDGEQSGTAFGDWNGTPLNDTSRINEFLSKYNIPIMRLFRHINISQAGLFIAEDSRLVDMQLSLNKFVGPGMLRDLFSKIMPIQDIIEIATIDKAKISSLNDVILKPSRFRLMPDNTPQYACI